MSEDDILSNKQNNSRTRKRTKNSSISRKRQKKVDYDDFKSDVLVQESNMEFNQKVCAENRSATLKACLTYSDNEERVVGLKCLTQCMKTYPSWFEHHKGKIEEYLVSCFESTCATVVDAAAVAFTSSLETGSAGIGGINYINNFRNGFKKVCLTIEALYDMFFGGFSTVGDSVNNSQDIFPIVPSIDALDHQTIANRIINCLILLKTLLLKPFSVEKQVSLNLVIEVIKKGLSTSYCFREEDTVHAGNRPVLLKKIQLHLFDVFRTLMKGCYSNLVPFSVIFENMLPKIFQGIAKCNCFVHDVRYKASAYKTLVYWLSLSKIINEAQFQEKILPIMLEDICPSRKAVLLNVAPPDAKKLKTSENDVLVERWALDALKHLLSATLTIDQLCLKEIMFLITGKLANIESNEVYDEDCQVKLFEVFMAFLKREDLNILPSLHLMTYILKLGINKRNSRISQIARDGLILVEKISHSTCPTLNFSDSHSLLQPVDWLETRKEKERTILQPVDLLETQKEKERTILQPVDFLVTQKKKERTILQPVDFLETQKEEEIKMLQPVDLVDNQQEKESSNQKTGKTIKIISDILVSSKRDEQATESDQNLEQPVHEVSDTDMTETSVCEPVNLDVEDMFGSFANVVQE